MKAFELFNFIDNIRPTVDQLKEKTNWSDEGIEIHLSLFRYNKVYEVVNNKYEILNFTEQIFGSSIEIGAGIELFKKSKYIDDKYIIFGTLNGIVNLGIRVSDNSIILLEMFSNRALNTIALDSEYFLDVIKILYIFYSNLNLKKNHNSEIKAKKMWKASQVPDALEFYKAIIM